MGRGWRPRGAWTVWRRREFQVIVALAGAFVLLFAGVLLDRDTDGAGGEGTRASDASPSPSPTSTPTMAGPSPEPINDELSMGAKDAPVNMVVFSDYRCPYCAKFATERLPELKREYVDTGKLRVLWRDYPYRGDDSSDAAVAARAAGRQGTYWEYSHALYERGPDADLSRDSLVGVARDLDLDTGEFTDDLDDPTLAKEVRKDFDFGTALGVPGTPAFLIDGEAFFGAQSKDEFDEAIDKALKGS